MIGEYPLSIGLVILGEPASKANSRKLVTIGGKSLFIKSDKARDYVVAARRQAQSAMRGMRPMVGRIRATIDIFYANQRPDLDESLILDVLQGICYVNDRQVRERHVTHWIDRKNPRAHILLTHVPEPPAVPPPHLRYPPPSPTSS